MIKDHGKHYNDLEKLLAQLNSEIPSEMKGFNELHNAVISKGALTVKTKELIALGIAITVRCDGCIDYHVKNSLNAGASSLEIMETIGVAILMGGGPALIYGCDALEALNQFIVLEKNGT
ncbi:carboxymuconolactone decarboxylase family protein [Lutibacter sp.]|uniref:carboxymuconolactone decarboxylase family protein n=1 Tax=Lutibacter sp. TaxID=1925666 RepID=UPI003566BB66